MLSYPFTLHFDRRASFIECLCGVGEALTIEERNNSKTKQLIKQYTALWDTGASTICISQRIVKELNIKSIGIAQNYTAGELIQSPLYYIDLLLPNKILITGLKVGCCKIIDTDILIGMDVITQGDMAISNYEGKTTFSFRVPTAEKIDFEKENNNKSNK